MPKSFQNVLLSSSPSILLALTQNQTRFPTHSTPTSSPALPSLSCLACGHWRGSVDWWPMFPTPISIPVAPGNHSICPRLCCFPPEKTLTGDSHYWLSSTSSEQCASYALGNPGARQTCSLAPTLLQFSQFKKKALSYSHSHSHLYLSHSGFYFPVSWYV